VDGKHRAAGLSGVVECAGLAARAALPEIKRKLAAYQY